MAEYVIDHLLAKGLKPAFISRGYGRSSKGLVETDLPSAKTIGDEPAQVAQRFQNLRVLVSEKRLLAVNRLEEEQEDYIMVLDDCMQHRAIKPGLMLLLSRFDASFYSDYILPMGRLREPRKGAARANMLVITKCPSELSIEEASFIKRKASPYFKGSIFFSKYAYDAQVHSVFNSEETQNIEKKRLLVFTGIADNRDFIEYLETKCKDLRLITFGDHHNYGLKDLEKIKNAFSQSDYDFILTTVKDGVRLQDNANVAAWKELPLFSLGIRHAFLFDQQHEFEEILDEYIG